jgi:hypothetical protein
MLEDSIFRAEEPFCRLWKSSAAFFGETDALNKPICALEEAADTLEQPIYMLEEPADTVEEASGGG